MKKYEPKELVAVSRYQNYFPTLTSEVQNEIFDRMRVLIKEEKEYCDKGNYKHMAQILTSITMYDVLPCGYHQLWLSSAYRFYSYKDALPGRG